MDREASLSFHLVAVGACIAALLESYYEVCGKKRPWNGCIYVDCSAARLVCRLRRRTGRVQYSSFQIVFPLLALQQKLCLSFPRPSEENLLGCTGRVFIFQRKTNALPYLHGAAR